MLRYSTERSIAKEVERARAVRVGVAAPPARLEEVILSFIQDGPRRSLLLYHIPHRNAKEAISLRRGKKPTRKQKIRLGQAGLSPENWLVVKQKQNGELVILHKHTDTIRVVPPLGQ